MAVTNNYQQADTGTKMIHIGKNTSSRIISKGISAGHSQNSYRGLVKVLPGAENARNYSQCDSLLLGDKCGAHTFPVVENQNPTAVTEHEATTSKISEDQLFYCRQRGIPEENAVGLIIGGYTKEVIEGLLRQGFRGLFPGTGRGLFLPAGDQDAGGAAGPGL